MGLTDNIIGSLIMLMRFIRRGASPFKIIKNANIMLLSDAYVPGGNIVSVMLAIRRGSLR
jgi:hypothetical protein